MTTNTLTGKETAGTTTETDDESCGCTALLPCFEHYLEERGRPAIRRTH